MNNIIILIIALFFLNNCSFNENSRIWKDKDKNEDFSNQENVKKLFEEEEIISSEFNSELSINITKINRNNKFAYNRNDYGSQNYNGLLDIEKTFTFSKLNNINQLDYMPAFLNDGLIFFDNKGTIIRYNDKKKSNLEK